MIKLMKKIFILTLFVLLNQVSVSATEATDYLSKIYSEEYNSKVEIKSKKEYCDKYEQKVGGQLVSSIIYGHADMKIEKYKKQKVSYICLFKHNNEILWGYVIPR